MLDAKSLLNNVNANGLVGKMIGGMATKNFAAGLISGGALTSLFGAKDTVETVAKVGGLAALGTLAFKAFNNYQQTKATTGQANVMDSVKTSAQGMFAQASGILSSVMGQGANPQQAEENNPLLAQMDSNPEMSIAIIRAMIAAAKADGKMDDAEIQKIMGKFDAQGIDSNEKAFLMQELANTPDISAIASAAKTPQEAAEIYLAALIVCDSQCAKEQEFLSSLATAMNLEAGFTQTLQNELLAAGNIKQAA